MDITALMVIRVLIVDTANLRRKGFMVITMMCNICAYDMNFVVEDSEYGDGTPCKICYHQCPICGDVQD